MICSVGLPWPSKLSINFRVAVSLFCPTVLVSPRSPRADMAMRVVVVLGGTGRDKLC